MTANLITLTDPRSQAAEAFRTLRTNLAFARAGDKPLHTILLTSCANSEDKSIALANLAVTFAQSGQRVIVVDADLHRPTQHSLWNIANEGGLMRLMTDTAALANPPLLATSVENLWILPAGGSPEVPADLLSHPRLGEVIGVLKARADYVLFDAPPVLAASDAAILSTKVDGVLLSVRAGATHRDHVTRAKQALERVNARILGSVLTNAPKERANSY